MTAAAAVPPVGVKPLRAAGGMVKRAGLFTAGRALSVVVWMPAPARLPPAGQVMLGVLAFAVLALNCSPWMGSMSHAG